MGGPCSTHGREGNACSVFTGPRSRREENMKWGVSYVQRESVGGSNLAHDVQYTYVRGGGLL